MSNGDWEDLREEVCAHIELGRDKGETELDTMTRLVWLERRKHVDLCLALETILSVSTTALECERGLAMKKSVILKWRKPKHTSTNEMVESERPAIS
jgi:hypothetical protein